MIRRVVPALLLAWLVGPEVARADPENALGLGPEAAARASAVSALSLGVPMVHYDPAALALAPDHTTEVMLSFLYAHPVLYDEELRVGTPAVLAPEPDDTAAIFAGTRFDLGSAIDVPGLHAALALYTPVKHIFQYETHPDDRPQWLMWGDRTQHILVWLGLGYRVTDWLSLGAGMRLVFDLELFTTGRVRGVTETMEGDEPVLAADTELGEELRVVGHAAPIVGAVITPMPSLRVGLVWRGKIRLDDWGWARVGGETGGLGALGYVYRFSHYYRPHELVLSAAWEPTAALSVSAELTWQLWSRAVSGATFDRLPGRYGDTLVPAVSGRYEISRGIAAMAGYRYVRSPFDNFGGPTNLLDNDRHEPSLGASFALDRLTGEDLPFVVSLAFRLAVLETREEHKDWQRFASDEDLMHDPGYPGYRHGGVVPSGQIGVEAEW